jgi:oligoendopeptidase F
MMRTTKTIMLGAAACWLAYVSGQSEAAPAGPGPGNEAAVHAAAPAHYHFDLAQLFASPQAEQEERAALEQRLSVFAREPAPPLATARALADWLASHDALRKGLQRHEIYLYLRAEEDSDDRASAAAERSVSSAIERLDVAAVGPLAAMPAGQFQGLLAGDPALRPYAHAIDAALAGTRQAPESRRAARVLAEPALDSLGSSYKSLRQSLAKASRPDLSGREAFLEQWDPYLTNESSFAALLVPIVMLHDGTARQRGR